MQGWDVPVCFLNAHSLEFAVLILNPILLQGLVHVHRSSQPLPDVAASMGIEFEVPLQDFLNCLLAGYFQNELMVCQHVDELDASTFLGQATYNKRLILPPFDLCFT